MVTGTQINVKSRIEAPKLISTAAASSDKSMPFLLLLSSKKRTCKKQERNWSTFFKSFWKIKSSMASVVIKLVFLVLFSVPVFCPHFFQYPEVYDQFYYRHELTTLFF